MALTSTDKQVSSLIINKVPSEDVYQQMIAQNLVNDDEIYIVQDNNKTTIEPATATPKANGTASVGTSLKYAREDHVHPERTVSITIPKGRVKGDALGVGKINHLSSQTMQKWYMNHNYSSLDDITKWACDIDGNGSLSLIGDTNNLNNYISNRNEKTYADNIFNVNGINPEYYGNWTYHFDNFVYWTTEITVENLNSSMDCVLNIEGKENIDNIFYKIEPLNNKIKIYCYMPPIEELSGILNFTEGTGKSIINYNNKFISVKFYDLDDTINLEDIKKDICLGRSIFLKCRYRNDYSYLPLSNYALFRDDNKIVVIFSGIYNNNLQSTKITLTSDDSTTTGYSITEENGYLKPSMRKLTLSAANWSTSAKTYTATVNGILEDATKQSIEINPIAKIDNDNAVKFGVYPTAQGENSITFSCDTIPTTAINFYITYQDVNYLS